MDPPEPTVENWPLYRYRGTLIRCSDGDTVVADVDFGDTIHRQMRLRLEGINTPELVGPDREAALKAMADLTALLTGKTLYIHTLKDKKSYDRYRALIYIQLTPDSPLVSVATLMAHHDTLHPITTYLEDSV